MAITFNTNEDINVENREIINRATDNYIPNRPIPTFIDDVSNTVANGNLLSEAVTIDWDSAIQSLQQSSIGTERTILTEEPFELNEMRSKVNKLFDDCENIKKENKELKEALNKLKEEVRFLRET